MDLLKNDAERWRVSLFGDRLHIITEDDAETGERATPAEARSAGIRVLQAREGRFSLEDVFISSGRKGPPAGQSCSLRT